MFKMRSLETKREIPTVTFPDNIYGRRRRKKNWQELRRTGEKI
jgi:hypothetical protein